MSEQKSLRQLARELGVSPSYLSQIRHGKRRASDRVLSKSGGEVLSTSKLEVEQPAKQTDKKNSVPGGTRTHDPLLRRQLLCPTELQGRVTCRRWRF